MKSRGASKIEVERTVLYGNEVLVKSGRKAKEMVFNYEKLWLGKFYKEKKIIVI